MNPSQFGPNFDPLSRAHLQNSGKKAEQPAAQTPDAAITAVPAAPVKTVAVNAQDALANYGKANLNVSTDSVMASSARHAIKQLDGVLTKITNYIQDEFPNLSAGAQQQLALATVHRHLNRS